MSRLLRKGKGGAWHISDVVVTSLVLAGCNYLVLIRAEPRCSRDALDRYDVLVKVSGLSEARVQLRKGILEAAGPRIM